MKTSELDGFMFSELYRYFGQTFTKAFGNNTDDYRKYWLSFEGAFDILTQKIYGNKFSKDTKPVLDNILLKFNKEKDLNIEWDMA